MTFRYNIKLKRIKDGEIHGLSLEAKDIMASSDDDDFYSAFAVDNNEISDNIISLINSGLFELLFKISKKGNNLIINEFDFIKEVESKLNEN